MTTRIISRRLAGGLSLLALAAAAAAQTLRLSPAALAPIGLPPLIIGAPSAPAPALASALSAQTQEISRIPLAQAAVYLAERAAADAPAERAAAKILAADLAAALPEPTAAAPTAAAPAAEISPAEGLRALARSARADPALSSWFDASAAAPDLGLDGLTFNRGRWRLGERAADRLGQGEFGFVDAHPRLTGAVMKTVSLSAETVLFSNPHPTRVADLEEKTARGLAAADAGPRYLGRAIVADRHVSVRERVYGETFERLAASGRFGPEERALVVDLLRRLAAAGLKSDDLRPSNVMIGTTALDGRRRAYLVDGGNLSELPPGTVEERVNGLLEAPVFLHGRMDSQVGFVETWKSPAEMLDEAIHGYGRTTTWLRFKGFWTDLLGRR
jgi:hypothetical protein